MIEQTKLSNNALAVMALASEYCRAVELAASMEPREFVDKMVKLLPRIYMAVTDIPYTGTEREDYLFGARHLTEAYYDQVRQNVAASLGEDDSYLDTFVEDMKYSDTPIGATISEGVADIFQVLYNFVEDVRDADVINTLTQLDVLRTDFSEYWSQTLCNILRPLNELAQRDADYTPGSDPAQSTDYSDEVDFV